MIYIYVEDKKEGFTLMRNAVDMYLGWENIVVDTFDGIINMAEHMQNIQLDTSDAAYYIYDDVTENRYVQDHLNNVKRVYRNSRYRNQIHLISIFCCEHSVLTAENVELFSHVNALRYIYLLKQYKSLKAITRNTKYNKEFEPIYAKYRKDREHVLNSLVKKGKIQSYTQNDIEIGVSAEKLCKGIFEIALRDDLEITDILGKCWSIDCCHKKNIICSMHINSRKLVLAEKKQFLVDKTAYYKIIVRIANEQRLILKETDNLLLSGIRFSKQALKVINANKQSNQRSIQECKHNIEQYLIYTNFDYSKAIEFCTGCGYTEQEAEIALNLIIKEH